MKQLITLGLCCYASLLTAQDCDCSSQLAFTINYYEQNNPAFQQIKASSKSHSIYLAGVEKIKKAARNQIETDQCILYLDQYVALLKDHHSDIGFNLKRMDLSSQELIDGFKQSAKYRRFKKIAIDTATLIPLLKAKKTADIEGIYSNGTSIVFGIIKKEKSPGNYIGVILRENKLLQVGHVLLELSKTHGNTYNVTYHTGLLGFNLPKLFKTQQIENGLIPAFGFSKTNTASNEKEYGFQVLNDSTTYLRLGSFDGRLTRELDSLYAVADKEIRSRPYLIIDIRGNSGGSERSYLNLLPYAYTRPFKIDSALVWVSPENIKRYEETASETNQKLLERMKAAQPFTFIPFTQDATTTWALDSVLVFPKKIALLFNRGSASAAEGMIVYLMQSDKVISIGENSGGYIGYGNVMTAQTPCEQFTIRSTTTRYFEKSKYEYIGIEPMYKVSKTRDWVIYAQQLLTNSK